MTGRPFVERIITIAKRSLQAPETGSHRVTARRLVARDIADKDVVSKLFDTIAPRYTDRQGGYTRLLRLGFRRGDSAEVAQVELLGSEFDPAKVVKSDKDGGAGPETPKKRSMGERLRGALGGGRKADQDAGGGRVEKRAKGGPKKSTAPRKAGGS